MASAVAPTGTHETPAVDTSHLDPDPIGEVVQRVEALKTGLLDKIHLVKTDQGLFTLCNWITFTWRDIVMLGGVIASVLLAVGCFFGGMTFLGIGLLLLGAVMLVGEYFVIQLNELLPLYQLAMAFKDLLEGATETTNNLAKLILGFLHDLNIDKEAITHKIEEFAGRLEGGVSAFESGIHWIHATFDLMCTKFSRVLTLSEEHLAQRDEAFQRLDTSIKGKLLELGRILGKMQAAAEQLDGLKEQVDALEVTADSLEGTHQKFYPLLSQFQAIQQDIRGQLGLSDRTTAHPAQRRVS